MSYSLTRHLRHLRNLSTAAAASSSTTAASSSISVSRAKTKLQSEFDPDRALEIYSSVSKDYTSPLASRYAQDLTVRRLAKCRRFDDIEALIESLKNDPKITHEPYFSTLIRSYGIAGMFQHALRTFEQMGEIGTPRSSLSFNALLTACNQSKLFDQVPKLFDEIPKKYGISPDKVSYGILVKAYCESGLSDQTFAVLKEMEEKGVEITAITFTTILDALYKLGQSDRAEKVWHEMEKKGCLDVGAYNVKIMFAGGGGPENVKALIDEMSNAGLKPDTISYNYLMTGYCQSGMMDEAKKVYAELKETGRHPNAATYRTLIHYLCQNGDFETGYKVFKQSVYRRKIPDFGTLKHLVEGLAQKKKTRGEAKGLIRTVKKKFPAIFLNAWRKVEEDLGLAGSNSSTAADHVEEVTSSSTAADHVEEVTSSSTAADHDAKEATS